MVVRFLRWIHVNKALITLSVVAGTSHRQHITEHNQLIHYRLEAFPTSCWASDALNLLSSIIRLHGSPLHILNIGDVEELARVGATRAQDRAPALAVLLLLAVDAALVEPAVLLCVLAVRVIVS